MHWPRPPAGRWPPRSAVDCPRCGHREDSRPRSTCESTVSNRAGIDNTQPTCTARNQRRTDNWVMRIVAEFLLAFQKTIIAELSDQIP